MPRCPHCEEEIDELNYRAAYTEWGTETGTSNLNGENTEYDERESYDSETIEYEYMCPLCDAEIDPEDIESDTDDICSFTEQTNNEQGTVEDITDGGTGRTNRLSGSQPIEQKINTSADMLGIECPKCHTMNYPGEDSATLCLNCNHEIIKP